MSQASSNNTPTEFSVQVNQRIHEVTKLPSVLCHLVSLYIPCFIYVVGWSTKNLGSYDIDHFLSYNPANGVQEKVAFLPKKTRHFIAVNHRGQLTVLLHNSHGPCELWAMTVHPTSAWKLISTLPSRTEFQVAVFQDQIYILGGRAFYKGKQVYCKSVKYYDDTCWLRAPSFEKARSRHAVAVLGDELYVIGGNKNGRCLRDVQSYNGKCWCPRPSLSTKRMSHIAVVLNGKLYVIGGVSSTAYILDTVECYDPLQQSWSAVASLNIARWDHAATVLNDRIFVFGGNDRSCYSTPTVECYNASQNRWTVMPRLTGMRGDSQPSAVTM